MKKEPYSPKATLARLKKQLEQNQLAQEKKFYAGTDVRELVQQRSQQIDAILIEIWQTLNLDKLNNCCLIAIGGYGRGELHPYSDVDILILFAKEQPDSVKEQLAAFIRFSWDIGLEIGHNTCSLTACAALAAHDITVITNFMESRLLIGEKNLFEQFCQSIESKELWPSNTFFQEKYQEQRSRYQRYGETAYSLQPNLKNGPGGLRDIQTIAWVIKRHFGTLQLRDLIKYDFLTETEFETLTAGQTFLWRIRFALHLISKKREDRLLFDHQQTLAKHFGYQDETHALAIEQFMKNYYRTIKSLRELNDLLLQLFNEAILMGDQNHITTLNERFQIHNDYIEVVNPEIIKQHPEALLEIFLLMAQHPQIKGVRASTIRLIRQHRYLVDDKFRQQAKHQQLFLQLLQQPNSVYQQLQRMNRYDILGNYIPEFGRIIGQMQYDLFHVYTVDQHSVYVTRNLQRFSEKKFVATFPLCTSIMPTIAKRELLFIAGVFHDIAKGQGGDHSELGAKYVAAFCQRHHLAEADTALVVWLVENHLLMSLTTQRKDIYDPETIEIFAQTIQSQHYLDHLYLLTVADICATNPNLWNSWKETLLKDLYLATKNLLGRQDKIIDKFNTIEEKQQLALAILSEKQLTEQTIKALWQNFPEEYFLRESANNIAWHTENILQHHEPLLICIKPKQTRGANEIFIYAHSQATLFACITAVLANNQVNILEANIISTPNGHQLDTYFILDSSLQTINDSYRLAEIKKELLKALKKPDKLPRIKQHRRLTTLQYFTKPTQVSFKKEHKKSHTIMLLETLDRPGLLAHIGHIFIDCDIHLKNAKIATMGERVEDVFFMTDVNNQPLTVVQEQQLKKAILQKLE